MPGTINLKGPGNAERPHRRAHIIDVPVHPAILPLARLEDLGARIVSASAPAPETSRPLWAGPYAGPAFDLDAWLRTHAAHLPPMSTWRPWRTRDGIGRKRHFKRGCPFGADHASNNGAFIGVRPNGAIVCACLHDRCRQKRWPDLRDRVEATVVIEV
jgi:hypothetical protein